jgi:hypothetical protein
MLESSSPKPIGHGPKARICYVCGRQYMLHSFDIHIKQCKELWLAREAQKDPRDRKKLPEDPLEKLQASGGGRASNTETGSPREFALSRKALDELNKMSNEAYNTETLDTCKFCGRTFLPEKLLIHNRSCTADNPARKVTDSVNRRSLDLPSETSSPAPSTSTPIRPKTSSSSINTRRQQQQTSSPNPDLRSFKEESFRSNSKKIDNNEEETQNMKVDNGSLVGHLGGASGRQFRKTGTPPISRLSATPADANIQSKEEFVAYMADRIDSMESMAQELLRNAAEMRAMLAKFSEMK